jgi:hypothetical protein
MTGPTNHVRAVNLKLLIGKLLIQTFKSILKSKNYEKYEDFLVLTNSLDMIALVTGVHITKLFMMQFRSSTALL